MKWPGGTEFRRACLDSLLLFHGVAGLLVDVSVLVSTEPSGF